MVEPMDNTRDIAARTQRFNEAARKFTPPSPNRHAKLATVGVAVGTDTIGHFLTEMNGAPIRHRSAKRTGGHRETSP
jgi:hypothetical protein